MTHDGVPFIKMHGCGNDFILMDGVLVPAGERSTLSAVLCRAHTSIGANGLIFVTRTADAVASVDFYNADGSRVEMCGNGSRCAARFAVEELGLQNQHRLETGAGLLEAVYTTPDRTAVSMPDPTDVQLSHTTLHGLELHLVVVGVPHAVIVTDDMAMWDDQRLRDVGSRLRRDASLFPDGTNVNVTAQLADGSWRVRTFERGVEDITLACGTGNTAVAFVLERLGLNEFPFHSVVDGGRLAVEFDEGRYWLVGPAHAVFRGEFSREALDGD